MDDDFFNICGDERVKRLFLSICHKDMLAKLDFCQNGYGNPKCVHPEEHENYIDFEYVNVNHLQINFCSTSEKCQHIGINNKSHKSLLCGDIFVYDKYLSISSRVYCEKSKIFDAIDFKYQNELERKAFIFAESFFEKIKICGNQNLQTYFFLYKVAYEDPESTIKSYYELQSKGQFAFNFHFNESHMNGNYDETFWSEVSKYITYIHKSEQKVNSFEELEYFINMKKIISY